MTVKELKEILNNFDDELLVKFPYPWYTNCTHVAQGINEMDGCVILDNYSEDEE